VSYKNSTICNLVTLEVQKVIASLKKLGANFPPLPNFTNKLTTNANSISIFKMDKRKHKLTEKHMNNSLYILKNSDGVATYFLALTHG
jgi:hypothetical protein